MYGEEDIRNLRRAVQSYYEAGAITDSEADTLDNMIDRLDGDW